MPSEFILDFDTDDLIEAEEVKQYGSPVNNLESGATWYGEASTPTGTTTDDYSVTVNADVDPAYDVTLSAGLIVHMKLPNVANTKPATLSVNGSTGKPIQKIHQPLEAGDLPANALAVLLYDEAAEVFQLVACSGHQHAAGDLASGAVSVERGGTGSDLSATGPGALVQTSSGAVVSVETLDPARGGTGLGSGYTKGDLLAATGSAALARVNVGSDGQILYADSTQSSGLRWDDAPSGGGGGGGASALDDLTDVTLTSPATGEYLRKSAGDWVNSTIQATDMPTGIDAANIGSGAVSNTEFGYLDGVTSAVQTQLDGKAASSHTHAASDINSGTLAVARGGTGLSSAAAGDLLYASASNTWAGLAAGTNGQVLAMVSGAPAWSTQTGVTGSGASIGVATWSGSSTLTTSSDFTFNGTTLSIGSTSGTSERLKCYGIVQVYLSASASAFEFYASGQSRGKVSYSSTYGGEIYLYNNSSSSRVYLGAGGTATTGGNLVCYDSFNATSVQIYGSSSSQGGRLFVSNLATTGNSANCYYVSGYIYYNSSSGRYKQDITDLELSSSLLHAIRPVSWSPIASPEAVETNRFAGFVAEEMAQVHPLLADWQQGRPEGINWNALTTLLIKGWQEHDQTLAGVQSELQAIRQDLAELRAA